MTHVLDNGLSFDEARQRILAAGPGIDLWKFGWGTAYLDPALSEKLEMLADHGVRACTGGTLLEIAWQQDRVTAFLNWAQDVGFGCVEVSCGSVTMTRDEKDGLIDRACSEFVVLAEIGTKDPAIEVSSTQWTADALADLAAGATWVVTEGRDSGTVGMFDPDGSVRTAVVDTLVNAVDLSRLLFEAPQKAQQAWLIRRFGANVNLGNIDPAEALAVEALRVGLRSDTLNPLEFT